jgi:RNA polymerase sigma-70 factor (ECF subfamily)
MDNTESHADTKLVARLLAGEELAFSVFFSSYFPRLFRFAAYRLQGDESLAEDVVQRTLYRAIDKLETYRGEAALYSWLCTFCRREISAILRESNRCPVEFIDDLPEIRATLESLMDPASTPESDAARGELARLIMVTMDSLPVDYAEALEWKYIDGMTVAEIADRQGRGHKAAESLLHRARQSFRDGFVTLAGANFDLVPNERRST